MRAAARTPLLWTLSLLLLGATTFSLVFIFSLAEAPWSTPVELGGEPDFEPADPERLGNVGDRVLARIAFAGDIMQHREQADDDFESTYREIGPALQGYDLVVANLEFPVDPDSAVGPPPNSVRFNGSQDHVRGISRAGVDLVSTANNHSFDMGLKGVLATLKTLEAEGIEGFGTGGVAKALEPKLVSVGPVKLSFVAYTFPPNVYMNEEGTPRPWDREWPINELHFDDWSGDYREEGVALFTRDVAVARANGADVIVAFVHWGQEWRFAPNRHQRLAARDMVEAGIDMVIGSHSHVLNPAELVDGHLVAYSLGNLVSAFKELEVRTAAILEVDLVERGDGGVSVGGFSFRPIVTIGKNHVIRPIGPEPRGEEAKALRHARTILGEAAVEPFLARELGDGGN